MNSACQQTARVGQLITAGLVGGVVSFAAIAWVMADGQPPEPSPMLAYIAAGFAGLMYVNSFVVPPLLAKSAVQGLLSKTSQPTDLQWCAIYQTQTIVKLALLEGAAFFNLVAYLVESTQMNLMIAAGLCLIMVATFPSESKVENWLENQKQMLEFPQT